MLLAAMLLLTTLRIGYCPDASGRERHCGLLTPSDAREREIRCVLASVCPAANAAFDSATAPRGIDGCNPGRRHPGTLAAAWDGSHS
jgi:hypothetical protein